MAQLAWGVQHQYNAGKLVSVQRKTRQKVDMYLVNTPVMSEIPYFELAVQLGDTEYIAEYTPRNADEELPAEWQSGAEVQARVEGHGLFLKRPGGSDEMKWTVVKRIRENRENKDHK